MIDRAQARVQHHLVCIAMRVTTCTFHHRFRSATTARPMPPGRPKPPPSSTCRFSVSRTATTLSSTKPRDVDGTRRRAIGSETRAKAPMPEPSPSPSSLHQQQTARVVKISISSEFILCLLHTGCDVVVNRCAVCLSLQRGVFDAVFCFFNAFSFLRKRDLNVFARWQENSGVEVMTSSKFCMTRHALHSSIVTYVRFHPMYSH